MTAAAIAAIEARRKLTNKFIATHEAERLRPFFAANLTLIAGDGSVILGAEAVIGAFTGQFQDPAFVTYVRATERVQVDEAGQRAAEAGTWTAIWREATGETRLSGPYLAAWRKERGQWLIESETFISIRFDRA